MEDRSRKSSGWLGNLWYLVLLLVGLGFFWAQRQQAAVRAQLLRAQFAESQFSQRRDRDEFQRKEADLLDQIEALRTNGLVYFPKGAFGADADHDTSTAASFARALRELREPSFWEAAERKDPGPLLRLVWLPSDGQPTAIRWLPPDRSNSLSRLEAVQVSDPSGKLIRGQVGLLAEHRTALDARLGEIGLWSAPARVEADTFGAKVKGGRWLLEAVKDGQYHILAGASTDDRPFADVGRTMLQPVGIVGGFQVHLP